MSEQNAKGKLKYESPILVPLGEMAKGSGVCATGSSVAPGGGGTECTAGGTAAGHCSAGTTATTAPGYCAQIDPLSIPAHLSLPRALLAGSFPAATERSRRPSAA